MCSLAAWWRRPGCRSSRRCCWCAPRSIIVVLVWAPYGFSLPGFLGDVVADPKVQARVATLLGDPAKTMSAAELGQRFLEPGLYLKAPIDQISLGMALVFGTAGLPHISDALLHRALGATGAQVGDVGHGHHRRLLLADTVLGFGAAKHRRSGGTLPRVDAGGNMAARCWRSTSAAAPTRSSAISCWPLSRRWLSRRSSRSSRAWCWPRPRRSRMTCTSGVMRAGKETPPRTRSRRRASRRSSSGARDRASALRPRARTPRSLVGACLCSRGQRQFPLRAADAATGSAAIPAASLPACWSARSLRSA